MRPSHMRFTVQESMVVILAIGLLLGWAVWWEHRPFAIAYGLIVVAGVVGLGLAISKVVTLKVRRRRKRLE